MPTRYNRERERSGRGDYGGRAGDANRSSRGDELQRDTGRHGPRTEYRSQERPEGRAGGNGGQPERSGREDGREETDSHSGSHPGSDSSRSRHSRSEGGHRDEDRYETGSHRGPSGQSRDESGRFESDDRS